MNKNTTDIVTHNEENGNKSSTTRGPCALCSLIKTQFKFFDLSSRHRRHFLYMSEAPWSCRKKQPKLMLWSAKLHLAEY